MNFKAVRFAFSPNASDDGVDVKVEPALPQVALGAVPSLVDGPCDDWRRLAGAAFISQSRAAAATFPGSYARSCGVRDWHVALLDHPTYVHGMFSAYFAEAGGEFGGAVREGRAPLGEPFAVLESPPLYDVVRDVNKLSNNVMARQVFLTLATTASPLPATPDKAAGAVQRWLAQRKLAMPGFTIENGSGLSRVERVTAGGLASLLAAADASAVRNEFATSLAVAATDGTLERRMTQAHAAGRALLKTGSLEGVRALAGYVIDANGTRWILVALVNHPNASRAHARARLPRRVGVPPSRPLLAGPALMSLLDVLAEQRIEAAIAAGEFDNLPGAGKPLALDDDSLVPEELRVAYRILKNAGFVPPELLTRHEIASVEGLLRHATDDATRRRAIARLALLEAKLEAEGRSLPRGSYRDRIIDRVSR